MTYSTAIGLCLLPLFMSCSSYIEEGKMTIHLTGKKSIKLVNENIDDILTQEFKKNAPMNIHLFFYSHYLTYHKARAHPLKQESETKGDFIIHGTAQVHYLYEGNIFFYHTVSQHSKKFTYTITGHSDVPVKRQKNTISKDS